MIEVGWRPEPSESMRSLQRDMRVDQLLLAHALRILRGIYRQTRLGSVFDSFGPKRLVLKLLVLRDSADPLNLHRKAPTKIDQFGVLLNDHFGRRVSPPARDGDKATPLRKQPGARHVDEPALAAHRILELYIAQTGPHVR